ncbi:MAG: TonB-dependent receptor [Halieaceae bacterium]|nr:TonB-dependent receptor [Halieaceae bacterium]
MAVNAMSSLDAAKKPIGLAVTAAISGVGVANAQDSDNPALEEVLVTATKRQMNLQEIPVSITAITDEQITLQRFKNFSDYVGQIPSLALTEIQPGGAAVVMRGCAAQGLNFVDSATTSVYLDEQPITAAGQNPDPRLIDIARVEALAGPQGTLFGDAAQCGTLRIITNKPDTTATYGWIDVTGSSIDGDDEGYDLSAMANIPLMDDKAALRVVGFYADEAGWMDNVRAPSPRGTFDNFGQAEDDVNSSESYGGRIGLRLMPAENWTIDFSAIYQNVELDGFADADLNQQVFEDTDTFPRLGDREQIRYTDDNWEDEWYQLAFTVEADLDIGNFVLTGAYFDRENEYFADSTAYHQTFQQYNDYLNAGTPYYEIAYNDFGGDPRAQSFDERETTSWTLEARYATPTEGRWSAIVGAFYNKRDLDELFYSKMVNGFSDTPHFAYQNYAGYYFNGVPLKEDSENIFTGTYESELTQWAAFGEVSFDVTENFTITAGTRYFDIENDFTIVQATLLEQVGTKPNCEIDYCFAPGDKGEADETDWVSKVNLSYTIDDQLLYATYSEGFRRGGANSARPNSVFGAPNAQNPPPAGTFNQFDSDTVDNYEIGAKTEWFDGRLRVNFAAFYMVWDDIQIQANDPQEGVFSLGVLNFPEAEITGFEAFVNWAPTDNLALDVSLGYNDGELSDDDVLFPDSEAPIEISDGTELPIVPDWTASANFSYTFDAQLFNATPYFLGSYTYTGESINSLAGVEASSFSFPPREQDSWYTVDLQFGLETETWTAALFVDNVTDEDAELFFNNRWSQQRLSTLQPRTYGFNLRYNFVR